MRLAEYSDTGSPRSAGANSTTPRATPSFNVEAGLRLTKVSSTAASSGWKRSITEVICRNRETSRIARGRSVAACTAPAAMWVRRLPVTSITPQPVCRNPGSSPRTRIVCRVDLRPGSGAEPRHYVLGHFEIGIHVLDIVAVLECLEQLEQCRRDLLVDRRRCLRAPDQARRGRRSESTFEGIAHAVEIIGRAGHE